MLNINSTVQEVVALFLVPGGRPFGMVHDTSTDSSCVYSGDVVIMQQVWLTDSLDS